MNKETSQPNNLLPWHSPLWQHFLTAYQQDRLPHALLLCGPQGMGKSLFAQRLANTLLCDKFLLPPIDKDIVGQPCDHCKSCHLLKIGNHPDLFFVQPAEAGKAIAVDQIRELIQLCMLTAHYGRYQIVILNPAEAMNRNAANSLLKLLEEPPPKTILLLVSHQPMALLATIRSRCQRLDFSHPDPILTQTWLQHQVPRDLDARWLLNLTSQAPLAALELVNSDSLTNRRELFDSLAQLPLGKTDPIRLAEQWNELEIPQLLGWMLSWTMDLIRYAVSSHTPVIINQDYREVLQRLAKQLNLRSLFKLLDLQREVHRLVTGGTNVNTKGLLETIAITWQELGTQPRRT